MNTMHAKPLLSDWKAVATSQNCIHISISNELEIDSLKLRVLGENRQLLTEISPERRELDICTYTGNPTFVELVNPDGHSVQYVVNSGGDRYSIWKTFPN